MAAALTIDRKFFTWARKRSGLEMGALEARFPNYGNWEDGRGGPTFKQLEAVAKKTRAPLGYFFLPDPPEENLNVPDFRTTSNLGVQSPTPELIDTVYSMQRRQDWMRQNLIEQGATSLGFIGSKNVHAHPREVAADMRKKFGMSMGWSEKQPSWRDAFRFFRNAAEQAGVLVVINGMVDNNPHRLLKRKEFQGFVLSDKYAPLVFVNGADYPAAQMFTLAHELAHLWIDQDALFDFDRLLPANNPIEEYCNRAAAEFLVPANLLRDRWERYEHAANRLDELRRAFKVSEIVIARRALDLNLISRTVYFDFYDEYKDRVTRAIEVEKAKPKGRKGHFWNSQNTRIGRRFGSEVIRAAREGRLLYRDAYSLTGLKRGAFAEYERRLGFEG